MFHARTTHGVFVRWSAREIVEMSAETDAIHVTLSGPNSGGGSYLVVREGRVDFVAYGDEALGTSPISYTYDDALRAYATHPVAQRLRDAIARATLTG